MDSHVVTGKVLTWEYDGFCCEEEYIRWKNKRRNTLIGCILISSIGGIDYSIIFNTLFLYLQDTINTDYPNLYYGIVISMSSLSALIFGPLSGIFIDKTRNLRVYLNVVLALKILGSFMYALPYSVALTIVGRFLAGIGDCIPNVCTGELVRIYEKDDSNRAMWWLSAGYSVAFIIGPSFNFLFKWVHFRIGILEVNYLNFVGIFMAILLLLSLLIDNTLVHNCSLQFDLKEFRKRACDNGTPLQSWRPVNDELFNHEEPLEARHSIRSDSNDQPFPWKIAIKSFVSNFDTALIFLSSSVFAYTLFGTDVIIPLLILNTFEWELDVLTYFLIGYGVTYAIFLFFMSKLCNTPKRIYCACLVCIVAQLFQFALLMLISLTSRSAGSDIALFTGFCVLYIGSWCIEEVLMRSMIAQMVPSQVQSFTEAMRSGMARIGFTVASLTAPLMMPYLHWWALSLMIIFSSLLFCFVVRRGQLQQPTGVDFELLRSRERGRHFDYETMNIGGRGE